MQVKYSSRTSTTINNSLEIEYVTDDLFEEVDECITCPVCFNKFQSPIMGCSNGHAVYFMYSRRQYQKVSNL